MDSKEYAALVANCVIWHARDEHTRILAAIDQISAGERDYALLGFYARALNNMDRYEEALDVLLSCEEEGREDGLWYFRVGYSLYYLNREEEAAFYFQRAIDYGDDCEDTRNFLKASLEEARIKKEGGRAEMYSEEEMNAVEAHIEKHFGAYKNVFHELVSPNIHIDIAVIEPNPRHNYYTLVTLGMGAHRMNVPGELRRLERAELLVSLPPDWRLDKLDEEIWYWPLRWLKIISRLPIEQDTWLGWGHTIPAGGPFAGNTALDTILLLYPGAYDQKAFSCPLAGGGEVRFYQMIPIFGAEADFKIEKGAEALLAHLGSAGLEYVVVDRKSVC